MKIKNETIEQLKKELEENRHLYQELRRRVLLEQGDEFQNFLTEFDEVKRELFFLH